MKKVSRQGLQALVEICQADIERHHMNLPLETRARLLDTVTAYLRQSCSFDDANRVFTEVAAPREVLLRMRGVLECDPTPIPYDETRENPHKKTRAWTPEEDTRLLAGILKSGLDNWSVVAASVGNNRTRAQCAQRWSRGLNPRICKDTWTPEEESKLLQYVRMLGDKAWTKISALIGNRSDVQCRYHYHQICKSGVTQCMARPDPVFKVMRTPMRSSMPSVIPFDRTRNVGAAVAMVPTEVRRGSVVHGVRRPPLIPPIAAISEPPIPPVPAVPPVPPVAPVARPALLPIDGFLKNFQ